MSKFQGTRLNTCPQEFHSPKKQEESESQEEGDYGERIAHGVQQLQGRQQGMVLHLNTEEEQT